jgi:hypothetical protein
MDARVEWFWDIKMEDDIVPWIAMELRVYEAEDKDERLR